MSAADYDNLTDDLNGDPPTDDSREVDLSLIRYMLSLTPAQRLARAEEYAEWILSHQKAQGRDWLAFVNSSNGSPRTT